MFRVYKVYIFCFEKMVCKQMNCIYMLWVIQLLWFISQACKKSRQTKILCSYAVVVQRSFYVYSMVNIGWVMRILHFKKVFFLTLLF